MEKYHCLICNQEMSVENKKLYSDYTCNERDDHHFTKRIRDDKTIKMRVRLSEGASKLLLKIHYDAGFSEVWTNKSKSNRLRINAIIVPDFSNIEKLKNKIRTLLVLA